MTGKLKCMVVTPEATLVDQSAEFVALPLYDGEIGIGAGHSPLVGRLGFGEMRLRSGDAEKRYYVDGGFVQVAANQVTVLTGHALPAADVDEHAAREQLETALKRPANTRETLAIRERLVAQARGRLRVARRAK